MPPNSSSIQLEHGGDVGFARDIGEADDARLDAELPDLRGERLGGLRPVAIGDGDVGAGLRKRFGRCGAEAGIAAGHQRLASFRSIGIIAASFLSR